MIHNERLVVVADKQNAIVSATVFPIEWFSETDARQLPPRDLVPGELGQLAALFDAATIAKCNALADQVATLTKERDQALEQLELLPQIVEQRDALLDQVATLTSERDQALEQLESTLEQLELLPQIIEQRDALAGQVETITAERDQALGQLEPLQRTIDALQAELDAIRNPPGPDLSTVDGAKQFISSQRFGMETGGFRVGDQFVSTERDEIGHWFPRYFNAYQWKMGDKPTRAGNPWGWYPFKPKGHNPTVLTADQVVRAYDCMTWFINSCFAVEAAAYTRLDAGDAIADVINSIKWPQNAFEWIPPTPTE